MTVPDSLGFLEQRRASITNQIVALGDLRCGSITSTTGRCGKAKRTAIAIYPGIQAMVRIFD